VAATSRAVKPLERSNPICKCVRFPGLYVIDDEGSVEGCDIVGVVVGEEVLFGEASCIGPEVGITIGGLDGAAV
jgi:hypothetical protein